MSDPLKPSSILNARTWCGSPTWRMTRTLTFSAFSSLRFRVLSVWKGSSFFSTGSHATT